MKKCALITGGSRGIGSAICQKLAFDSDYHILINYQYQYLKLILVYDSYIYKHQIYQHQVACKQE